MSITAPAVELRVNQPYNVIADNVPLRLIITELTLWNATFTVTGPNVRNPGKPRTMPLMALACWLELAKPAATHRCQSTNHKRSQCYGTLWQCSECGKTVCCNEGTDDGTELCDDCWAKKESTHATEVRSTQ